MRQVLIKGGYGGRIDVEKGEILEILNVDGQSIELDGEPRLMVYLDNAKLGSVEQLRTLPIGGVVAVRYFTGSEATYRWGAGHGHGVIQVLTSPQ